MLAPYQLLISVLGSSFLVRDSVLFAKHFMGIVLQRTPNSVVVKIFRGTIIFTMRGSTSQQKNSVCPCFIAAHARYSVSLQKKDVLIHCICHIPLRHQNICDNNCVCNIPTLPASCTGNMFSTIAASKQQWRKSDYYLNVRWHVVTSNFSF